MTSLLLEKLKSRKLWVTVAGGFVVLFGKALGLNLSEAQLWDTTILVASFVGGQGLVDVVKGYRSAA